MVSVQDMHAPHHVVMHCNVINRMSSWQHLLALSATTCPYDEQALSIHRENVRLMSLQTEFDSVKWYAGLGKAWVLLP